MSLNFKSKGNALVSVLACNVMMKAYSEEENWPDDFVKVGDIQASRLEDVIRDFFLIYQPKRTLGLFPANLGKGTWPKLEKNDPLIKIRRN